MKADFAHLARFIEIKNRKRIKFYKSGLFTSLQRGWGSDFRDIRKYNPGDDTRFIDWNVTSRMNELFVREYHDEHELNVNVFLDISSSMNLHGLLPESKYYYGFQIALLLALVFAGSSDRFRLILYSGKFKHDSGIIKTRSAVLNEMKHIYDAGYAGGITDYLLPFRLLREKYPKRSLSYIISDFTHLPDLGLYSQLHKQHDLTAIRILDGSENIPADILSMFQIKGTDAGAGDIDYRPVTQVDGSRLKDYFHHKTLDLNPLEPGAVRLMEFLNR